MINAISAAEIAFIMSSSMSAWLLSPLECSPQKQNDRTLPFCFWRWIMWKMYNKTIIEFGFRMISWIIKTSCLCYLPQSSVSANNTDLGFDNGLSDTASFKPCRLLDITFTYVSLTILHTSGWNCCSVLVWQYGQLSPLSQLVGSPHSSPCLTWGQGVDLQMTEQLKQKHRTKKVISF